VAVLLICSGCQSSKPDEAYADVLNVARTNAATQDQRTAFTHSEDFVIREGDVVRITFAGSPSLNTVQAVRRDGKISLQMAGEVKASGLRPVELEKELMRVYADQLVTKEVSVAVESSAFYVFITGAVGRPGRLVSDRPLTALEAVIDAGVDYSKANLSSVVVIRNDGGKQHYYNLNLKKELQGQGGTPFPLRPSDIIFVRERFTWF
jgi:polysaccharide export outer membrane protein